MFTHTYTQLPFVLRIHCLKYLDLNLGNDTKNYGYFLDDCMRKQYRVFGFHIDFDMFNPKTKIIKGIDTCNIQIPITSLKNGIPKLSTLSKLVTQINLHLNTCIYSNIDTIKHELDFFNNCSLPKNVKSIDTTVSLNTDSELGNTYSSIYDKLILATYPKPTKTIIEFTDSCINDEILGDLMRTISVLTDEQKATFEVHIEINYEYFGITDYCTLFGTPNFWQVVGSQIKRIYFSESHRPGVYDWNNGFLLQTVFPSLISIKDLEVTPYIFADMVTMKMIPQTLEHLSIYPFGYCSYNTVDMYDLANFLKYQKCQHMTMVDCNICLSEYHMPMILEVAQDTHTCTIYLECCHMFDSNEIAKGEYSLQQLLELFKLVQSKFES